MQPAISKIVVCQFSGIGYLNCINVKRVNCSDAESKFNAETKFQNIYLTSKKQTCFLTKIFTSLILKRQNNLLSDWFKNQELLTKYFTAGRESTQFLLTFIYLAIGTKYYEVKKIKKRAYVHKIWSTWKRYKFQFTTVQETGNRIKFVRPFHMNIWKFLNT